jgi:PAS domain S-box-containing protein
MSLRNVNVKENCEIIIFDSLNEGLFTVNKDWNITFFNKRAEEITGISREKAIGKLCRSIFHSNVCDANCLLKEAIRNNKSISNRKIYIINSDGCRIPLLINGSPLKDEKGNIIGGVETFQDISEIEELKKELKGKYSYYDFVTIDKKLLKILEILPQIARSDSNILITGESGTGKELIARAIHNLSNRKEHLLVPVSLGALPENLVEAELFGYAKGAFTGAYKPQKGKFVHAEKGTIFLDEIGDIPLQTQVKLLRTIQERVIQPLGSNDTINIDVRIVSATNKDLEKMMKTGQFREDLYYRINVVNVHLSPLRERKSDIPLLINYFIEKFNIIKEKNIQGIAPDALAVLAAYNYPGNIRELENIIEFCFIMTKGALITIRSLPEKFKVRENNEIIMPVSLKQIEKKAILESLKRNNYKVMATCRELGISKDTLRRKRKQFGIPK